MAIVRAGWLRRRLGTEMLRVPLVAAILAGLVFLTVPGLVGADPTVETVATGLASPRGVAFGPEGALYVVEAGAGGSTCVTVPGPEGDAELCAGNSGAVTRVWRGSQERVATGLPSLKVSEGLPLPPSMAEVVGPHYLSFLGRGNAVLSVGLGGDPAGRAAFGDLGKVLGHLVQLPASGDWLVRTDVSAYESSANPDGGEIDTNPYGVLAVPGATIVADAGANALLRAASDGQVTTLAVFPDGLAEAPPFLGLPPGTMIPVQAVPTSVALGPDGAYYVGQLTGFPFPVGGANIYRVVPGQAPTIYASGLTNVVSIAFGSDGSLYAVEIATNGLLSGDLTGALKRVPPGGGAAQTLLTSPLIAPNGVAVGPDGAIYLSNNSLSLGGGEVLRVQP